MKRKQEQVEILDSRGNAVGKTALLELCHENGLWHKGMVLLMLTDWGELLLETRSVVDSVVPRRWGIPEMHVRASSTSAEAALRVVAERFGLNPILSSLIRLTEEGQLVEELYLTSGKIIRQRKTVYAYRTSWDEYRALRKLQNVPAVNAPRDYEYENDDAEVLGLRFSTLERVLEDVETVPGAFAATTLTVLRDAAAFQAIVRLGRELVHQTRSRVTNNILVTLGEKHAHSVPDSIVLNTVLPQPDDPAPELDVRRVFLEGKNTCPGAYRIGEMIDTVGHLRSWREKLTDPYERYLEEDVAVLSQSITDPTLKAQFDSIDVGDAKRFVREILYFPLEDGTLLRTCLGNLEEITAASTALTWYLRSHTAVPHAILDRRIEFTNRTCNRLVADVWKHRGYEITVDNPTSIRRLLLLNVLLNALDFHSPDFRDAWTDEKSIRALIEKQFDLVEGAEFSSALGGDTFLHEFLDRCLYGSLGGTLRLVYLTDNNGQLVVSLKCIEAFLHCQPRLNITLVPKNGQPGNDSSWRDVEEVLRADVESATPVFGQLRSFLELKRLVVCRDGPATPGLHPGYMSRELCSYLGAADAIFTEGQAYAELRGWLRPTYMLFQIKGRVAEAIHGIEQGVKALAFIRVGSGVAHFTCLKKLPQRVRYSSQEPESLFHVYGQTTTDYVKAILSENYNILRGRIFDNREEILISRLRQESNRLDKSMAEIVLGSPIPTQEEVLRYRKNQSIDAFAIGGGGGFNQVTLKALEMLGIDFAAGVPSTDDGGSTGKLQRMIAGTYGYMFGVGDAAAILERQVSGEAKRPILSFRPPEESDSLTEVLIEHILTEASNPTIESRYITDCSDFLSFVCEQLNFSRVIDNHFLGATGIAGFSIKGASIRNLNILAAFHLCGAIDTEAGRTRPDCATDENNAERSWLLLEKALGLIDHSVNRVRTLPVTYDRAWLWATYKVPISETEIRRLNISMSALSDDRRTVFGQQYIDQIVPSGKIVDFGVKPWVGSGNVARPRPNKTYVEAIQSARLFIMGAGSLFGSQLAQLAIPGIVDELILRRDIRKVLVLNHVCMNETTFYSVTDHIKAIERLANKVVNEDTKQRIGRAIWVSDIFTDVVVPRTVAREVDLAIQKEEATTSDGSPHYSASMTGDSVREPIFVRPDGSQTSATEGILLNRYVAYVLSHPEFRAQHQITDWELRVLSVLEQPPSLYGSRTEAGRYRGAVYALEGDIKYLMKHGIPRRHIHEVESIAMNTKILKAAGKPELEEFPGLIPESLVGLFKIMLAKGAVGS